jgi:hypothetical protein
LPGTKPPITLKQPHPEAGPKTVASTNPERFICVMLSCRCLLTLL